MAGGSAVLPSSRRPHAATVSLCTSRPAHRSTNVSITDLREAAPIEGGAAGASQKLECEGRVRSSSSGPQSSHVTVVHGRARHQGTPTSTCDPNHNGFHRRMRVTMPRQALELLPAAGDIQIISIAISPRTEGLSSQRHEGLIMESQHAKVRTGGLLFSNARSH